MLIVCRAPGGHRVVTSSLVDGVLDVFSKARNLTLACSSIFAYVAYLGAFELVCSAGGSYYQSVIAT